MDGSDGWTPNERVWLVCTNLAVNAGGAINVDQKGYGGGAVRANGCGPGAGTFLVNEGSGGGYGGVGGISGTPGGAAYGQVAAPADPGSGGGGSDGSAGGAGGGVVRIQAGSVVVNGTITASGSQGSNWRTGAGAGGSICILCGTFASTGGVVKADGGDGPGNGSDAGGSGGGGRIAIVYDPVAQSALNLTAKPIFKLSAKNGNSIGWGRPGTIYLPDAGFYPREQIYGGQIVIPGFTQWAPASLAIDDGLAVFTNGFQLAVSNDLTVTGLGGFELSNGTVTVSGNLQIQNTVLYWSTTPYPNARSVFRAGPQSAFRVTGNASVGGGSLYLCPIGTNAPTLAVAGNLAFTNLARFYVQSAPTNGASGACGAEVDVAKTLSVSNGCWVCPLSDPTTGGAPLFHLLNLAVDTNAGFNADSSGFHGGYPLANGYGPGGGTGTVNGSGGGGYGGPGGTYSGAAGGSTYGSSNAPTLPGSGAGGVSVSGGWGGGLIRIEADGRAEINGTLTARGGTGSAWTEGGGSGGAINLRCKVLAGTSATLCADGGPAYNGTSGGGGGGGRIAVWYRAMNSNGVWQVSAAQGTGGTGAGDGTIVWGLLPPAGTVFVLR